MEEKLDFTALKNSINSLERAISSSEKFLDDYIYETLRAGVIQNFEVCYELCWKFMERILYNFYGVDSKALFRKDLFRKVYEKDLIENPIIWFEFYKARNKTAHTYDAEIAEEVYEISKKLLVEAKSFLNKIEEVL